MWPTEQFEFETPPLKGVTHFRNKIISAQLSIYITKIYALYRHKEDFQILF